jgi:transposase
MAPLTLDIDLPPGVTLTGYHRLPEAHGVEIAWTPPETPRCPRCRTDAPTRPEANLDVAKTRVVRHLDIFGQPCFFCYQALFHRCPRCGHRQDLVPPFKRKETSYTFDFERHVLRLLIGSNEADVARRLGLSTDTVRFIVQNQLADGQAFTIDPARVITDVGLDEISLKKRHKLYVTILTDLSDPTQPRILAVQAGRDEAAAQACLQRLSTTQRKQVQRYRVDMGGAYHAACQALLTKAQAVVDRFHVAKKFGEAVDAVRKKNHADLQGQAVEDRAKGVPGADVGVSPRPGEPDGGGADAVGGVISALASAADAVRLAGGVQTDLRSASATAGSGAGLDGLDRAFAGGVSGDGRVVRADV